MLEDFAEACNRECIPHGGAILSVLVTPIGAKLRASLAAMSTGRAGSPLIGDTASLSSNEITRASLGR